MKYPALTLLALACALVAPAAEKSSSHKKQSGRMSTVSLLASVRISGKGAPDGMRFLFLVARQPEATGNFTIKETRDFLLGGESYQSKTETEVGQKFEPETVFNNAEAFFSKQPSIRKLAPDDLTGAYVLTVAIGGAKLTSGERGEITLNVGFDKQVEPFTFQFAVPPGPGAKKSEKPAP